MTHSLRYISPSFSLGRLASRSAGFPEAIFSGVSHFSASPTLQARLPPGPGAGRGREGGWTQDAPVAVPPAGVWPAGAERQEATTLVAPAASRALIKERRSI